MDGDDIGGLYMGNITYAQYCARRGYTSPFRGWSVVKRSLLCSWTQPGFHRFWRVWNPPDRLSIIPVIQGTWGKSQESNRNVHRVYRHRCTSWLGCRCTDTSVGFGSYSRLPRLRRAESVESEVGTVSPARTMAINGKRSHKRAACRWDI